MSKTPKQTDRSISGLTEQQLQSFACWIAGKCPHFELEYNEQLTGSDKIYPKFTCKKCGANPEWTDRDNPDYTNNATALLDDVIPAADKKLLPPDDIPDGYADWKYAKFELRNGSHAFCLSSLKALAQTPLWEEYMKERGE